MHDLRKRFEQRVCNVIQNGWVKVEVCECLCLKLKTLATEVIVDKVEHSAFSGIGRVDRRKCSQDGLLIRIGRLVDKGFRV
jgi:hypothetical protein